MTKQEAFSERVGRERVERDVVLAPYTTFRIGGAADLFYRARTADELATAVLAARELELPHFLLGTGANILVGDRGFRGVVIRRQVLRLVHDAEMTGRDHVVDRVLLQRPGEWLDACHGVLRGVVIRCEVGGIEFLDDVRVRAGSGVQTFPDLIVASVARGLGGLQHYVGIPSTVGGAIWQNLHFLSPPPERERTCFIEEVLESAEILTEEGERRTVDKAYFRFGYDYSILHDRRDIVLSATFRLAPADPEWLRWNIRENLQWRDDRHPDLWLYPSAGSVFQKLEGIGAGRLIDQVGLKGHVLGNAGIFHKHANIIVNFGGATAAEVRGLIDLAQATVARELGYELRPEIGFIGEF